MKMRSERSAGWGRIMAVAGVMVLVATGCAITRVSVSSTGTEGNKASEFPLGVTDDGRYVLFNSQADNLVPGDSNGAFDVFRHDTQTGATVRVDVTGTGAQLPTGAFGAAMTANGRYVAFDTRSAALPTDTNGLDDAYVRDLVNNTTTLVSPPPSEGFLLNSQVGFLDISSDGRYVSFLHGNTAENALYRHDRQTGTTTRLTGPGQFNEFHMSGDARHYAIETRCDPPGSCIPTPLIFDADGSASGWPALQFPKCPFDEASAVSPDGRYLVWYSAHVFGSPAECVLPNGSYVVDRTTGVASPLNLRDNPNTRVVAISRNAASRPLHRQRIDLPRRDGGTLAPVSPRPGQRHGYATGHLALGSGSRRASCERGALRGRDVRRVRHRSDEPHPRRPQLGQRRVRPQDGAAPVALRPPLRIPGGVVVGFTRRGGLA